MNQPIDRRTFLRTTAAATLASPLLAAPANETHQATGTDLVIKLGPFPGATKLFLKVRTGP